MKNYLLLVGMTFFFLACQAQQKPVGSTEASEIIPIQKDKKSWKAELSKMEYYVLREGGTERAFSGQFWDHHEEGTYICAGCELKLFASETKFDSGTGWPSFFKPYAPNHIIEKPDNSFGWNRTEVLCARCGGHLGHLFDDGPKPTGLRYCINSASLDFVKKEK